MPPKSQRSRACAQCRSRRVKCDETPDTCNQCRRLGLTCSGPLQGTIVIDMTERVAKPRARKKKETARATMAIRGKEDAEPSVAPRPILPRGEASTGSSQPLSSSSSSSSSSNSIPRAAPRDAERVEQAVVAIRYQYRPPMLNQPSRVLPEALDTAFLSHYIEMNKGGSQYAPEIQWLSHIPQIHTNARKSAVRLSLRAVSMAYFGKHYHDPSILVDSWRWYTVALSAQRTSIARLKRDTIPDEEEVLVPLIMSLYELYVGATASGTMAHIAAAAGIMTMRGPSNCGSGIIWPLFKGLRTSEAHKCVVYNQVSVYSAPDWMTLPFIGKPRDAHQSLADIELQIPPCMAILEISGSMRALFATPIPSHVDVRPGKRLACKLMRELDEWAIEYPHLASLSRNIHGAPTLMERALIASNYVADRLVVSMLIYKMQTEATAPPEPYEKPPAHYFEEAKKAATSVLEAALEIERAQTPGFDLLRSIAPVLAVAFSAPTSEIKQDAVDMMKRWAGKFGGLDSIVTSL
ncbi:hypothetical protein ACET3X_001573 [Alternaria dauci]|uniref:Zn(2)-C6 fungal-type domain-containing protein n=1 Tax=Alternaria dauci TaxID=48095 RepID=A0ABR3V0B2_9PLEO